MKGDARTRTAGKPEEMPTRCFMQIFGNNVNLDVQPSESIENGSFTFSVALPSNTDYTFLFWADNNSGDTPADLRAVQYTPGTVAFAANVQGTLETVDKTVELKHVVAKVTLKTMSLLNTVKTLVSPLRVRPCITCRKPPLRVLKTKEFPLK